MPRRFSGVSGVLAGVLMTVGVQIPMSGQESEKPAASKSETLYQQALPGPEHQTLASFAGDWEAELTFGAGPAARTTRCDGRSRMVVGGRFLQMDYRAKETVGSDDPASFSEGQFQLGFDRRHRQFTIVAMDNWGTYFVTGKGQEDSSSGKIRLAGTDDDPQMKAMGLTKEFVYAIDLRDRDRLTVDVLVVDTRTPARREFKLLGIVFKRRK